VVEAANMTPFQKGEQFLVLEQNMFGEEVSYLKSIIDLQSLPPPSWYLRTHDAKRHRFRSLRSGIPMLLLLGSSCAQLYIICLAVSESIKLLRELSVKV
jgi:hypothetical protein